MVQLLEKELILNELEVTNRLTALYLHFESSGDVDNANKLKQLIDKTSQKEFMVGFCGHFSAGKSTMMNKLMGKEVLPSSPIPTSANLVKIKKGRNYARVFYKQGQPVEFPAPYDYEVVKNFAKDGNSVEAIEISDEDVSLPEDVAIMDTPGIDSTDEAHRISTESALHLADIILYVMDYNHVQSEENFTFTKTLKDREKPVYLVVNMIDKHNEDELSFQAYRDSVISAFNGWGVKVDGIFFTTLKDLGNPHNEYEKLEQFLTQQMLDKEQLLLKSVLIATKPLIDDHLAFLEKQNETQRLELEKELEHLPETDRKIVIDKVISLEERHSSLISKKAIFFDKFNTELSKILDNAYLMPAATRELAHAYIESKQSDFKVGILFSKKKTEEERKARLQAFYESLKQQVQSQLDWHLKDFIVKYLKVNGIEDESLIKSVYEDVTVEFTPSLLEDLVKKGAGLTGEYILNYTKDVAAEIKGLYRKIAVQKLNQGASILDNNINQELDNVKKELSEYQAYKHAVEGLRQLKEQKNETETKLVGLLTEELSTVVLQKVNEWLKQYQAIEPAFEIKQMEVNREIQVKTETQEDRALSKLIEIDEGNIQNLAFNVKEQMSETVNKLKLATGLLSGVKGMQTLIKDMNAKANRIENNSFTVALFGAFSAGKSSFANALIGEKLLPVSPNPTTATINKILPTTENRPHGTVLVKVKTEEQLYNDVRQSFAVFDQTCVSMEDALQRIRSLNYDSNEAKEKPHYAFLKAVQLGYEPIAQHLGQVLTVDLVEFQDYVAKEEKSCFVEWIELYYDCPLTKQGITLVDTPGADSINARHTGVAFEYIKNADAILFVTYYNHAFSKADREFLIQLGRVKETFEMDKMFFIVNAADLAKSEEELLVVTNYVGEELQKYGIRIPRIYPLSSKLALDEKIKSNDQNSGMPEFERAFHSFIMNDLAQLSIQSAHEDLRRTVIALEDIIHNAKESDEVKKKKREEAELTQKQIVNVINSKDNQVEERSIKQEVEELIFYVKQRVFFRYNDFYNEAFNPSSLREDGRDMKKAIQACFDELIQALGFDLAQEMRATSLRIEKYMNKMLKEIHLTLEKNIQHVNNHIQLLSFESKSFKTLTFENALQTINKDLFRSALTIFKGSKSFFEQGGKAKLKQELQPIFEPQVDLYLQEQLTLIKTSYLEEFNLVVEQLLQDVLAEVNEYYEGYLAALSEKIDINHLENVKKEIQSVL
ncbi:dynamin family protein [Bacillus sp. Marseille-P3661]|uniref:dynamin family protein n=1 Tax=Bacillus sp. Marseille-P3661 TaxID=1936234 RepID=UPI000C8381BA|nr:dynamin family protein [Bacillus sp. Marseille-P3661]